MKCFAIITFCAVAVSAMPRVAEHKIYEYIHECVIESGIDPDSMDYSYAKYENQPKAEQENCYLACIDKKLGLMNEDGTYNLARIIEGAADLAEATERMNDFYEALQVCQTKARNDVCKLAGCMHGEADRKQ